MNDAKPRPFSQPDAVLQEVWAARKKIYDDCGHDIGRLFAEARERQRKSGRPSVNLQKSAA